jgi:hypothetical protein
MNKKTKIALALGIVGIGGYLLWKSKQTAKVSFMSYDGLGLGAGGPAPQDPESMKGAPGKLMKVPTPKSTPDRKKTMPVDPREMPMYQSAPANF